MPLPIAARSWASKLKLNRSLNIRRIDCLSSSMSGSAFCIGVIAVSQRNWRGHQALRLTKRACQSHPREHTLIYGDAVHSFIACAQRQDLARRDSMAEWCRAPLWKIRLRKKYCRLDRCPFLADDAY